MPPAAPEPDPQQELRELLAQCIELAASGGFDAVEPLLRTHPQHADTLRERLRKLAQAGLLETASPPADSIPERLGDFRLVRRLGAGGMGVVYLAVQESLGREVALKLVKPEQLFFPGARERFRREVDAIARLHDPGIVGIHTVGEDAGIPYFAMERIAGATLSDALHHLGPRKAKDLTGAEFFAAVVAATPDAPRATAIPPRYDGSWVDTCLRIAEEMARALGHAHAQGVLHRDLKPSNVMVTPTGRVVLLDFGLAQARGATRLTRTGAQLGSLHYMAPEQVHGLPDEIDERTDVYAIGVVLYELLALRLPFRGETAAEVSRAILAANPERLVRCNSAVTWDVETVCLLAMDPDRAMRYPSATALLRDLRNLLARRPIEARRPGAMLRARRFAQRHRAMTTALVVAGLAIAATPIVIAIRERGLNFALSQSIVERDREMARARANVEVASQALNRVLQRVADEDIDQIPDLRGFVEGLLQETGNHLDALFSSNPTEPGACLTLAETLGQAGNLRWRFRDFARADAALARALELLAAHAERMRAEAPDRFEFALLDTGLALALLRARSATDRGPYVAELRRLLGDAPAEAVAARPRAFRERWASGQERLAAELTTTDAAGATAALQRALAVRRRTADEFDDVTAWLEVAQSEAAFFGLPAVRQDLARRTGHRQRADDALLRAASRPPRDDAERRQLALQMIQRSSTLRGTNRELAGTMLTQAIAHLEQAVANRPSRLGTRIDLASAMQTQSGLQLQQGHRAEGLASKRRTIEILRPLVASWPQVGQAWLSLLDSQVELTRLLAQDPAAAAEIADLLGHIDADVRQAMRHRADIATIAEAASNALATTAQHDARNGAHEQALAKITEAIDLRARARELSTSQRVTLGSELGLRSIHAEILLANGQRAAALATLQAIAPPLPKDLRQRIPGLDAVAAEPGFAELLRAAEGR